MGFFDKLEKSKSGHIFISHSHDDIVKVREIRNSLEKDGFEPLCFYLKCLNDDSEIEDLIKREIDAREWFIFVNSENARKSKWVTLEREYITKTNSKKIITVDLNDEHDVSNLISNISRNLRVFISFHSNDCAIARKIKEQLEAKDYLVFFAPDSISTNNSWATITANALFEASQEGCVIALISQESMRSVAMLNEIGYAFQNRGRIIPIMIGDVALSDAFKYYLIRHQFYHLSENPTDQEINNIIDKISYSIISKK